ncbi:hypothetical protein [Paraflavitalea speifideaquila]|uniref:hypothetical protein n=1 Tax=Paraflavitalea speifideaquila TaxID=3076558 RepID=UPI0028EF806F|nr:hypothetical protein [Paraflavitalea speifideiaquila]
MLKQLLSLGTAGLQDEAQIRRVTSINMINLALAALILTVGSVFVALYFRLSVIIPITLEFSLILLALWFSAQKNMSGRH